MKTITATLLRNTFAAAFMVVILASSVSAAVVTWNGTTSTWSTSTNWVGNSVPSNGDTLVFTGGTVTMNNDLVGASFAQFSFTNSGNWFTFNGNALTLTNSTIINAAGLGSGGALETFNTAITLSGNISHLINAGAFITINIAGNVSSASALDGLTIIANSAGNGSVSLSGSNSYTGNTSVTSGILKIGSATALGASTSSVSVSSGAVLDLNGTTMTNANALTLNGSGISSGGALKNGSATSGTYAGLVSLGSDSSIIAGSGNITLSNIGTISATTGSGFNLTVGGAKNTTISSIIGTGTGGLTKNDAGTLFLTAANTYSGNTIVNSGTLQLNNNLALQNSTLDTSGAGTVTLFGIVTPTFGGLSGSKDITSVITNGYNTFTTLITLNPGTGVTNTYSGTIINGAVAGTGITKSGNGTQILSGSLTYTGATTVNSGTLVISGSSVTGNSAPTVNNGGTLQLDYSTYNTSKLNDSAVLTFNGGTVDLKGGAHTETVLSGTLTATSASKVTSSTPGSVLQLNAIGRGAGATIDFGASNIANTDNLNTNGILGTWATVSGSDYAMNSGATTAGGATVLGSGTADGFIRAYSNYTDVQRLTPGTIADVSTNNVRIIEGSGSAGSITLESGTTTINSLNQSASGGTGAATITLSGKVLQTNGVLLGATSGTLTIGSVANEGTLRTATSGGELVLTNFNTSNKLLVNSTIADNTTASALIKTGPGTVTIASTGSSFTGATRVDSGTLEISGRLGSAVYNASIVVSPGATLLFNGATNNNPHNNLNGGGSVIKDGSGSLTLDNPNNNSTLSGGYFVKNGSISGWNLNSFGTSTITMGGSGSTGATLTGGSVTFTNPFIINAPDSGTITVGNAFTTGAGATFNGAFTLNGNVTFATASSGSSANLTIGGGVTGTGSLTLNNQSTATAATGGITLSGNAINPIGSITAQGSGKTTTTISANIGSNVTSVTQNSATAMLVLSGSNSYSGGTTISSGTLALSGAGSIANSSTITVGTAAGSTAKFDVSGLSSGTFSVASGQTLKGGGTVVGNVSVGTGATLAPGNSPGTLSQTGTMTYASGGTYAWEMNKANGTKGADPGWDWQNITGTLNIAATSGSNFTIDVRGLALNNSAGVVTGFSKAAFGQWAIATASGGVTNYSQDKFAVSTGNFTNNNSIGNGAFSVQNLNNDLNVVFNPNGGSTIGGLGIFAQDNASQSAYPNANPTIISGSNGGFGFGGWTGIGSNANSGNFLGDAKNNAGGASGNFINTSGNKAWGFYGNNGSTGDANRPITGGLSVGRVFALDVDTGWSDNSSSRGYSLRNSSDNAVFEFYYKNDGSGSYRVNDSTGEHVISGLSYTGDGMHTAFVMTSANTYAFTITGPTITSGTTITGTLINATGGIAVDRFRPFAYSNQNNVGNANYDTFFNSALVAVPTFDGQSGASGAFSNGANWAGHALVNGASIAFDGGTGAVTGTNDTLTSVYNIAFNGTQTVYAAGTGTNANITTNATTYTLTGNALTINGGIDNNSTNLQTINNNLTLGANQTFNATNGALTLGGTTALNGKYLTVNAANAVALNGSITGNGDILKSGSGTLTLAGSNTFTGTGVSGQTYGQVFITNGTVRAATNNALGMQVGGVSVDLGDSFLGQTGSTTNYSTNVSLLANSGLTIGNQLYVAVNTGGATRTIGSDGTTGAVAFTGNVLLTGSAILTAASGGDVTMSGTLGTPGFTAGGITKTGAGKVTLTASNAYTGATTVSSGTLQVGNGTSGSISSSSAVSVGASGTLAVNQANGSTFANAVTNSGAVNMIAGGTNTLTGSVTGGTLNQNGSGVTVLNSSTPNSFAPTTVSVNSGTLLLGGSNQIGNSTAVNLNGGTFNTGGKSETVGALTLSANSTFDMGSGASVATFASAATGSWSGTLSIYNWSGNFGTGAGTDQFILSASTLTQTQLDSIQFFSGVGGTRIGNATLRLGSGELVPIPEPATIIGALAFLGLIVLRERRRLRGVWVGFFHEAKHEKI